MSLRFGGVYSWSVSSAGVRVSEPPNEPQDDRDSLNSKEVIKIDTSDKPNRPLTTLRNLHLGGIG